MSEYKYKYSVQNKSDRWLDLWFEYLVITKIAVRLKFALAGYRNAVVVLVLGVHLVGHVLVCGLWQFTLLVK